MTRTVCRQPYVDDVRRPAIDVALNPVGASVHELSEAARLAEAAGFEGVWCYDHLSGAVLGGTRCVEVWTALGALARATSTVAIGPLVLNAAVRHPAHIATAAASIDELSDGRLWLGLGAGAGPESAFSAELAMLGLPVLEAARRRSRVRDAAGYLRALWAGASSYDGAETSFQGVVGVARPLHPVPLVIAANGPRMARLAGEVGDALNVHNWQADLVRVVSAAREAASGRGAEIDVSVEAPFDVAWLDRTSATHAELAALDVARVIVRWEARLGPQALGSAAKHLAC